MRRDTVEVTVGRAKLFVPVVIDEATTQRVAERVNDRLEAYQMQGGRIDDLTFALRAAFEFAADLERVSRKRSEEVLRLKQEAEEDSAEAAAALDKILQALRGILDKPKQ
jgi:cell division protein ZapA (FtsZ GTPase activity inhibitor)